MNNHNSLLSNPIQIKTIVDAPLSKVWAYWTLPDHICKWNAASEDWHTTHAENDLKVGGKFKSRMEAKNGEAGFDFGGTYDELIPEDLIYYHLDDGRKVLVNFEECSEGVEIKEAFEPENENPREMQQMGWQSILNEFKAYTEAN